jgi:hypothetical protein
MGTVFRAHDHETGEPVALKVLRATKEADAVRFEREALVLQRLRHPGVVRYVTHGVTDAREAFLAMEWLEGIDLRHRLAHPGITIAECMTVGQRLAEALSAVHAVGVVHRDVKPSNIFLVGGSVANVKLIDFGLVRTDGTPSHASTLGLALGTPGYMAPEQARGDHDTDYRADLFSLGCVLFKCLTGYAPFDGQHVVATLSNVLREDAPRTQSIRPEVPDALDALIDRLLRKVPSARPESAAEVSRALADLDPWSTERDAATTAPLSRSLSGITGGERRGTAVLLVGSSPRSVVALADARLDALDPTLRRVLRAASVFGGAFWVVPVALILGASPACCAEWLDALVTAELVSYRSNSRFPGEAEATFCSHLVQEAAYASLTDPDRLVAHRVAGEWLDEQHEPDPMVLAYHFERAGHTERANAYHVAAGEKALHADDIDAALVRLSASLGRALSDPLRIKALGLLGDAHVRRGDFGSAMDVATQGMVAARPGSVAWAKAAVAKQTSAIFSGRLDILMDTLHAVRTVDPEDDACDEVVSALHIGTLILCLSDRFTIAEELVARVVELCTRFPGTQASMRGRVDMCHELIESLGSGEPGRALRLALSVRAMQLDGDDPLRVAWAQVFVAIDYWALGAFGMAKREMMAVSDPRGRSVLTSMIKPLFEGLVLIDAGAFHEARDLAQRMTLQGEAETSPTAGTTRGEGRWLLAEIALREGDVRLAEREADAALGILRSYPLACGAVRVLLAEIRARAGRPSEALAVVRGPLASLEAQGGRGFRAARTRVVAVKALLATGDREGAKRLLALARDRLLVRALSISDAALRRSFLEDVAENAETLSLARETLGHPGEAR